MLKFYTVKTVYICEFMTRSTSYCLRDTLMDPWNVCMHACMMYAGMYVCLYVFIYVCMYVMHVCVCVCARICMYSLSSWHFQQTLQQSACEFTSNILLAFERHMTDHKSQVVRFSTFVFIFNPLKPELNPICYLLALLGAHHLLHVSRIRVKSLTLRLLMSYIYAAPILDVSRSHTTTQHSR